jgi:hypothetical protein
MISFNLSKLSHSLANIIRGNINGYEIGLQDIGRVLPFLSVATRQPNLSQVARYWYSARHAATHPNHLLRIQPAQSTPGIGGWIRICLGWPLRLRKE